MIDLNPIPAGGGGAQFDPPCSFFLHNLKSIGLRLLKFSDFSYIPKNQNFAKKFAYLKWHGQGLFKNV